MDFNKELQSVRTSVWIWCYINALGLAIGKDVHLIRHCEKSKKTFRLLVFASTVQPQWGSGGGGSTHYLPGSSIRREAENSMQEWGSRSFGNETHPNLNSSSVRYHAIAHHEHARVMGNRHSRVCEHQAKIFPRDIKYAEAHDFDLKGRKRGSQLPPIRTHAHCLSCLHSPFRRWTVCPSFHISQGRGVCGTGPECHSEIRPQPRGGVLTRLFDPPPPNSIFRLFSRVGFLKGLTCRRARKSNLPRKINSKSSQQPAATRSA